MGRFLRGKDGNALTNKKIDQRGEIGTDLFINILQSNDSTVLTVRDGLNVDGDLDVTGDIRSNSFYFVKRSTNTSISYPGSYSAVAKGN